MDITRIVIFGAGAAGANTLLHLLHTHPALDYTIVDFDTVEERNISAGTQPYTKGDIRRTKVHALQKIARQINNKRLTVYDKKIVSSVDVSRIARTPQQTLVIDAFDNAKSRNIFLQLKDHHILHIGFSGQLSGEVVWDSVFTEMTESKADTAIDVCELHLARPFIFGLTSIAAMVASEFIDKGVKKNVYFDRTPKVMVF